MTSRTLVTAAAIGAIALFASGSPSARTNGQLTDLEYDVWTESAEPEPAEATEDAALERAALETARCRFTMWTVPLDTYANLGYKAWFYDPNDVLVDSQVNWQYKPGLSGYLLAEDVQPGEYRCVVEFYLEANLYATDEAYFLASRPTASAGPAAGPGAAAFDLRNALALVTR